MREIDVIIIIAMHTLGDWYCQPRWMALGKSSNIKILLAHIQCLIMPIAFASMIVFPFGIAQMVWLVINLVCHAIQDWYIWRICTKLFLSKCKTKEEAYNTHAFWNIVATDSLLHYVTYFISLYFVKLYFNI